jgi:hypothetical protein
MMGLVSRKTNRVLEPKTKAPILIKNNGRLSLISPPPKAAHHDPRISSLPWEWHGWAEISTKVQYMTFEAAGTASCQIENSDGVTPFAKDEAMSRSRDVER